MLFRFRAGARRTAVLALGALVTLGPGLAPASQVAAFQPLVSEWQFVGAGPTPPNQAACNAVGRRCFNPEAMANSYNYASLHTAGTKGAGRTIAIVDSFGSDTIANDLKVFNNAFGLPHMCGEPGVTCTAGM